MLRVRDEDDMEFWFLYDKDRRLICEDMHGPLKHHCRTLAQARAMCVEVGFTILEDTGED